LAVNYLFPQKPEGSFSSWKDGAVIDADGKKVDLKRIIKETKKNEK
jgi:hypothetical protein